ncbi:arylsulfotransferase family protein [Anaerohalosphaera lusitana]|nr:arylsulfotransferase family protein [Anaerohalosphaera lusitana]
MKAAKSKSRLWSVRLLAGGVGFGFLAYASAILGAALTFIVLFDLCVYTLLIAAILFCYSLTSSNKQTALLGHRFLLAASAVGLIVLGFFVNKLMTGQDPSGAEQAGKTQRDRQKLLSMPYLDWAKNDGSTTGVIINKPEKSYQGPNLTASKVWGFDEVAYLYDMEGELVHRWTTEEDLPTFWEYAELTETGDLLAIAYEKGMSKFDWDSNLIWDNNDLRPHHDFFVSEGKHIFAMSREDSVIFVSGIPFPILEDTVVELDANGKTLKEYRYLHSIKERIPVRKLASNYLWFLNPVNMLRLVSSKLKNGYAFGNDTGFDLMHSNSIQVLERDLPELGQKGDFLLSIRELDLVCVYRPSTKTVVWSWGPGTICRQHHPTALKNGNVLIFDNGTVLGYSRILEIGPGSKEILWSYNSQGNMSFFSGRAGGCQRLPNGNTLITESHKSHVFEVTERGEIVWSFINPLQIKNKRPVIYRMMRITDPEIRSQIEKNMSETN